MTDPDPVSAAVMFVEGGEKIAGLWTTPQIANVGSYKLSAKKRRDGKFEWVHFQHRQDDTCRILLRGEAGSRDRLSAVLEGTNNTLLRIHGVIMRIADRSATTTDGKKVDGPVQ